SGNATSPLHLASPLPLLLLGDAIRVHSERALRLHRNRDAEQGLEPRRRTDETPPSPPLLCERGGCDEMNVDDRAKEGEPMASTATALITGGTSGIGRAAANKLAQLGIHVLVVGRNVERGEKTVAAIRAAGSKADFISSDLRDAASARKVARRAVELGNGHVDILVNNAGMFPFGPTHETTEEAFDDVYSL